VLQITPDAVWRTKNGSELSHEELQLTAKQRKQRDKISQNSYDGTEPE